MLHLPRATNRVLKNAVLGAVLSAIHQKGNAFRTDYERRIRHGMIPSHARHTVARKLLTVMWGMWKRRCQFGSEKAALRELIQHNVYVLS